MGTYESWLDAVGPMGAWQASVFFCSMLSQIFEAMMSLSIVFMSFTPEFRCSQEKSGTYFMRLNHSEEAVGAQCSNSANETCSSFIYDTSVMKTTIVTEWDLVCSSSVRVADAQMVFMLGFLFGSLVSGYISDRFGRKRVIVVGGVMTAALGVVQSQAAQFPIFLAARFLLSFANTACFQTAYVLCMEVTSQKYKDWVGSLFFVPFAIGYVGVSGVAYFIRDWRTLNLVISIPIFVNGLYYWILPESPRWLLSHGKGREAQKILLLAAKLNGRLAFGSSKAKANAWKDQQLALSSTCEEKPSDVTDASSPLLQIFKDRRLSLRCLAICSVWLGVALVYYGISLNVGLLGEADIFVKNAAMGAVEIPAYLACLPLLRWGRKRALVLTLGVAAVVLATIPLLSKRLGVLRFPLFVAGKGAVTAAFNIVYVVTAELYPTRLRNSGVSVGSFFARIGSALAPYIPILPIFPLGSGMLGPMLVFAGVSLLGALVTLTLPETRDAALPDSFGDPPPPPSEEKEEGSNDQRSLLEPVV